MHAPLLSRDVAVRRPGADHPAADFAVRGASDMARADIRIRACRQRSPDGGRRSRKELQETEPSWCALPLVRTKPTPTDQRPTKIASNPPSQFAALRRGGHPTEGLSTIVTLLGLRFPPGEDERMFLYPEVGIEALTSRERGAPLRLGLKRNIFWSYCCVTRGYGKGERTRRGRERQSLRPVSAGVLQSGLCLLSADTLPGL